jgi:hypothetical protein
MPGADSFADDLVFKGGEYGQETGHRAARVGVVRSSASVSDTKATPSIDLAPPGCGKELFAEFALCRAGTNLFDLSHDVPATLRRVLPYGANLQRQRLLVVRGYSRIQTPSQKLWSVLRFSMPVWRPFGEVRFAGL